MGKTGPKIAYGFGALLVVTLFMWGCTSNTESMGHPESTSKEGAMHLEKHAQHNSPVIPALDAAAPAVFETASFGLG